MERTAHDLGLRFHRSGLSTVCAADQSAAAVQGQCLANCAAEDCCWAPTVGCPVTHSGPFSCFSAFRHCVWKQMMSDMMPEQKLPCRRDLWEPAALGASLPCLASPPLWVRAFWLQHSLSIPRQFSCVCISGILFRATNLPMLVFRCAQYSRSETVRWACFLVHSRIAVEQQCSGKHLITLTALLPPSCFPTSDTATEDPCWIFHTLWVHDLAEDGTWQNRVARARQAGHTDCLWICGIPNAESSVGVPQVSQGDGEAANKSKFLNGLITGIAPRTSQPAAVAAGPAAAAAAAASVLQLPKPVVQPLPPLPGVPSIQEYQRKLAPPGSQPRLEVLPLVGTSTPQVTHRIS